MKRILVVGCPRSGTTLIQHLLSAHNDVYSCPETHYFQRIRRRGKRRIMDNLFLSQANVLRAWEYMRSNNSSLGPHDARRIRSLKSAAKFFDHVMTSEAEARGRTAWVEKTPGHLLHVRLIKRHIPSAQFVHVLRDGRDVVASLVDAAERFPQVWQRYADLEESIRAYNLFLEESLRYWGAEGHLFVRYEHILDEPQVAGHRLYVLLGLEGEDPRVASSQRQEAIIRGDEDWKRKSTGEITDTRLVKFNRIFDDQQRRLINSRLKVLSLELEAVGNHLHAGDILV